MDCAKYFVIKPFPLYLIYENKRTKLILMTKPYLKAAMVAALLTTSVASFAQKEKKPSTKKEEGMQTIVITRNGNIDEKTVIEIKGDKVLVNGKESDKTGGVKIKVHTFSGNDAFNFSGPGNHHNWMFPGNGAHSFFAEDSNRAMLGVVTAENEKGAEITSVSRESAAEKAGLKKGDIITKIGDKKIAVAADVSAAVRSYKPGDKISITFLRDGKEQKITAELGKWKGMRMNGFAMPKIQMEDWNFHFPTPPSFQMPEGLMNFGAPKIGMSIQDMEDGKGVKVIAVEKESNAEKAGIKEGDIITKVNDKQVLHVEDVTRTIRENKDKSAVQLQVNRNGSTQTMELRLPHRRRTVDL